MAMRASSRASCGPRSDWFASAVWGRCAFLWSWGSLWVWSARRRRPRLPAGYEPLLAADDGISVAELVEDELLLALPQIPRHQDLRECEANGYAAPGEASSQAERRRPFAALASLLADSKRST